MNKYKDEIKGNCTLNKLYQMINLERDRSVIISCDEAKLLLDYVDEALASRNNKIKIDVEIDTNDLECRLKNLKGIAEDINDAMSRSGTPIEQVMPLECDAIDSPNININNCKNVYISVYPNDILKDLTPPGNTKHGTV